MDDKILYTDLRSNDVVMENFQDMAISQEGRDRIKYIDVVTEAFSNPTKNATLLNKLFKDIQKVEEIDFGKIPDSKGDITKYVYYDHMYKCIEVLNNLVENNPTPSITSMNKLHQILLAARPDFTFGYRTDNYIIINAYNLMVTSLYEMINVCAVDATEYLRAKLSMELTTPTAKQIRWVTKTTNQFIKMYESGQWATLMKSFKSSGHTMVATEASFTGSITVDSNSAGANFVKGIQELPGKIKDVGTGTVKVLETIPKPVKIVSIIIALFFIMRKAIYYFINSAGKLSDRLKNISTILRANVSSENSPTAVEKQKKMLNHLENVSDVIDYKIVKSEKAAAIEEKKANKADFSPQEITNISGADFEL